MKTFQFLIVVFYSNYVLSELNGNQNDATIARQKRFSRRRFCRDPTGLISEAIITNFTHEYVADLQKDNVTHTSTQLILNIRWDAIVPDGLTLDGFIVHVAVSEYPTPPSMLPINICTPRYSHFWVRLNHSSHDNATSNASCTNQTDICSAYTTSSQCLCDIDCDLTDTNCKGTGTYYIENENFFSVPNDIRFLQFSVDFYSFYTAKIYPYYREYFHRGHPTDLHHYNIDREVDCPNLIEAVTNNNAEATQLCCDLEIPLTLSRNFTYGEFSLDYGTGTANVTVSWLPPLSSKGLDGFFIYPTTVFFGLRGDLLHPSFSEITSKPYIPLGDTAKCDNTSEIYQASLYQLYPTQTYMLHVTSVYNDPQNELYKCEEAACVTVFELTIPEIHACDPMWNYCDNNADCLAEDITGWETLNATCICNEGFIGNGRNTTTQPFLGNGCTDFNACLQNVSFCGKHSICLDNPAPQMNVTCVCPDNYLGNGYEGCEHQAVYVVKIAIPLIVVAMLFFTYLAWRIRLYQAYKHDIKWSQFVSNDTLIYNLPNGEEINLSDVCTPAFGQKWELDRARISMGDVIGRGNYGVVYRGTYSPVSNVDDTAYNQINDVVAIKTVKEGYNEKVDLLEFFAEIGFMLNVGKHPNVLGVIGCCTTQKPVLLITEYLKYGDLLHFLWDSREPAKCLVDPVYHVTEKTLCQMARQVAIGMEYLTKTRIIHGDLAARNILVGEDLICKISDFGLANDVYRYGIIQGQTERLVPFKWISPERMMEGKVPITSKSDVWSFGNLMYEMVTLGCMPHPGIPADFLLERLKEGYRMEQPNTCSDEFYSIMSKCWKWRAHSRPSFIQLTRILSKLISQNELHVRNLAMEVQHLDREEYLLEINQTNNDLFFAENQHSESGNENGVEGNSPPEPNTTPYTSPIDNESLVIANRHLPSENDESHV